MFCDRCGTGLITGQNYCHACGKPIALVSPGPARSRLEGHIKALGILWMVYSGLRLLPGAFLSGWGWHGMHGSHFPHFFMPFLGFLGGWLVISAILGFMVGWGLLERQSWARPLAIFLGVLALFHPLLGTALGIYTLWAMLSANGEEYNRVSRSA